MRSTSFFRNRRNPDPGRRIALSSPRRSSAEPTRRFQVLALDGGGVRGMFEAALLAALEIDLGMSVVDCFDLVVGTSTGGILALGLGARIAPSRILDFYVEHHRRIF